MSIEQKQYWQAGYKQGASEERARIVAIVQKMLVEEIPRGELPYDQLTSVDAYLLVLERLNRTGTGPVESGKPGSEGA